METERDQKEIERLVEKQASGDKTDSAPTEQDSEEDAELDRRASKGIIFGNPPRPDGYGLGG